MKAYVVTHCVWTSFGSMLQSLGLKKALASLGRESCVLYDRQQRPFRLSFPKSLKSLYYFPPNLINRRKFLSMREKGLRFISENIDVTYFSGHGDLCQRYPHSDLYIAGSDQIWSPGAENPLFFLDFVRGEGERKVSYAASLGASDIPDEKKSGFRERLSSFESVSVREQRGRQLLENLYDKEISVNIDPVFLVDADEWRKYESEYPVKKPYILLYTIYWNDSMKDRLRQLSRRTGLPIYAVKPSPSVAYASKSLYDVGPEEFLWLIDHAEYVVTSSFHGAAFAALFNKKVSVVINPGSPSRLEELTGRLSLSVTDISQLDSAPPIDYDTVNKNIETARREGLDYLKKVSL